MKARIVIMPDGQVTVFADEGSAETARPELAKVFAALQAAGLAVDQLGQPEQHRHDDQHNHVKEVNHG